MQKSFILILCLMFFSSVSYPLSEETNNSAVRIVAHSDSMIRGGSCLLIFKTGIPDVAKIWIEDNNCKVYYPIPYKCEGYYVALLGWDVGKSEFEPKIILRDTQGTAYTNQIFLEKEEFVLKTMGVSVGSGSSIKKDKVVANPGTRWEVNWDGDYQRRDRMISGGSDADLEYITTLPETNRIEPTLFIPFLPIYDYSKTSGFGYLRTYYKKGKAIRKRFHLGLDLTREPHSAISNCNTGVVTYTGYESGYGNVMLVYHGLGLYSMYAHCSLINCEVGDIVDKQTMLGKTGKTGWVTGDHLHFAILIQGVFVDPEQWMSAGWVENQINRVFRKADEAILADKMCLLRREY